MLKGFHLSLLIGPVVARPVASYVIDALQTAQVTSGAGRSGFQLTFAWGRNSPIDRDLQAGTFDPLNRVILAVTVDGTPDVIMDGLITRVDMAPSSEPGRSTLTITGDDLSAAMDLTNLAGLIPYPAMPTEAIVALILAKYLLFGVVPMIIPSPFVDVPNPISKWETHLGTDLAYLRQCASRTGYVFYVEPGPAIGMSVAYWGPEIRYGEVQPALTINSDASSNVDALSFSFDGTQRTIQVVLVTPELAPVPIPVPIPIPDVGVLRPILAQRPAIPLKFEKLDPDFGVTKVSIPRAIAVGVARSSQTADAVTGSGTLDVTRYGRVLKPRKLVGVRGAGTAFDGVYYVKSVTHNLKRGEYKQSFNLAREGLMPIQQRVQP
jgi:hypothetical protein